MNLFVLIRIYDNILSKSMRYTFFYSDVSIFLTTLTIAKEAVINDIFEIIQAICIGLVVATFLYMTGRSRKAIELRSESLVLLNDKALNNEEQFNKFLCEAIYKVIFPAYLLISISTFE